MLLKACQRPVEAFKKLLAFAGLTPLEAFGGCCRPLQIFLKPLHEFQRLLAASRGLRGV